MNNNKTPILIKKLALEFDKIAIPELAIYNLTPSQFKILKYLLNNLDKEVKQRDIEKTFSMTNPTVTGILDNLEKNGWIKRLLNSNDARSKIIKVTTKTMDHKDNFYIIGSNLEKKFIKGLTKDEEKMLNLLLNKLFDNIKGGNE